MATIEELIDEAGLTDLCLSGDGMVSWDLGSGMEPLVGVSFSEQELKNWVLQRLSEVNRNWDARYPFVDFTWKDQVRVHVVFAPAAERIQISLRRLPEVHKRRVWPPGEAYDFLSERVKQGDSVLISGATGSGKTSLLCDLIGEISAQERILVLEDTPEVRAKHPQLIRLLSRPPTPDGSGEITLRDLLRQTLRMRPDRVILGECRGGEVLELLQLLNTGHRGAMASIHGNSPRDALRRVELLCHLATDGTMRDRTLRELIGAGLRWVVQMERVKGIRRIASICGLEGLEGDTILMRPMVQG